MNYSKEPPVVGNCITLFHLDVLTLLMRFVSFFGDGIWIPVILTITVAVIVWFRKDRLFAIILVLGPLVGDIVKSLMKNYFQIPRPGAFGCNVFTTYSEQYSFPSGHTVFYTIIFGLLAYYAWENLRYLWAKILLVFSVLLILSIGYSRIYLGAHWYLDIIGGYVIGGAILMISILMIKYLSSSCLSRGSRDPCMRRNDRGGRIV